MPIAGMTVLLVGRNTTANSVADRRAPKAGSLPAGSGGAIIKGLARAGAVRLLYLLSSMASESGNSDPRAVAAALLRVKNTLLCKMPARRETSPA